MSEVETARATLADLEAKLAAAEARSVELEVERRRLSYDAAVSGGDAAKQLDKLTKESATASIVIANARSAVEEAKRRLTLALRDEEMAGDRENAEAALIIGNRLVERGKRIDAALSAAQREIEEYKHDVDALHQLGCPAPTSQQFLVYAGSALTTFAMATPLKIERTFLSPGERRTFVGLSGPWHDAVSRWASRVLIGEAA